VVSNPYAPGRTGASKKNNNGSEEVGSASDFVSLFLFIRVQTATAGRLSAEIGLGILGCSKWSRSQDPHLESERRRDDTVTEVKIYAQ
jgi:hypothetical protein